MNDTTPESRALSATPEQQVGDTDAVPDTPIVPTADNQTAVVTDENAVAAPPVQFNTGMMLHFLLRTQSFLRIALQDIA